jgi:peroxiredoxin
MKINGFFGMLLLLAAAEGFSQGKYTVTGTLNGLSQAKVFLGSYYGEKISRVDSATTDGSGKFTLSLKPGLPEGLYRLSWGKDKFTDLILGRESVVFQTSAEDPGDSMKVVSSTENRVFYWYARREHESQDKLQLLMPLIDYYPQDDHFYTLTAGEFEAIQAREQKSLDSLERLYPKSYAVRMFRLQQTPYLKSSMSKDQRLDYIRAHFFDKADFNDTALLRSNIWPNKSIAYLGLYGNNRLTQKQLEAEFIKAVTVMLSAASVNSDVYKFLLDYLISGFDKYHFEGVITYMADNFQDPYSCEDQERKTQLQKKLDTFKKISIGKVAPDIEVPDASGKTLKLSAIKAEYTLLIFWSSECGHCVQMMPQVKEIYDRQSPKRYEILAISLDTSRTEWTKFIGEEKLTWLNASELKGFNSKSADEYNIYATPTMFLLDRDKKIVAKPISYRELEQALRENHLL